MVNKEGNHLKNETVITGSSEENHFEQKYGK